MYKDALAKNDWDYKTINQREGITMIKKMINWILNSEEQEELITPSNANEAFILKYKDLVIGYLKVKNGSWMFEYSEPFKNQNQVDALVDFPDKNKMYDSPHLWPFFSHRIPGLGQPQVQEIIKNEKIDGKNEVDLLKRFGQRSITNPFELAML